jgi:hypothetical protein
VGIPDDAGRLDRLAAELMGLSGNLYLAVVDVGDLRKLRCIGVVTLF